MFDKVSATSNQNKNPGRSQAEAGHHVQEREADQMASLLLKRESAPRHPTTGAPFGESQNQKEALEGETDQVQMAPLAQPHYHVTPPLLPPSTPGGGTPRESYSQKMAASATGAQPMSPNIREQMEDFFRTDLSQVRLHTDKQAAQLSKSLGARAFTFGQHIYFNQDQYQPGLTEGRRLLAHELTHTLHQRYGQQRIQRQADDGQEVIDWLAIRQFDKGDGEYVFAISGTSSQTGTHHQIAYHIRSGYFSEGVYYLIKKSVNEGTATFSWQDAEGNALNRPPVSINLTYLNLSLADRLKVEIAPLAPYQTGNEGANGEAAGDMSGTSLLGEQSGGAPAPHVVDSPVGPVDLNEFQNATTEDPFPNGMQNLSLEEPARPASPDGPGGGDTVGGLPAPKPVEPMTGDAARSRGRIRSAVEQSIRQNTAQNEAQFEEDVARRDFVKGGPGRVSSATSTLSTEDKVLFLKLLDHGEHVGAPAQDIEDLVARYQQLSDFEKELLKANIDLDTAEVAFANYQDQVRLALESEEVPGENPAHANYSRAKAAMAQINSRITRLSNGSAPAIDIPWHPFLTEITMLSGLASGAMNRSEGIAGLAEEIFANLKSIQLRASIVMLEAARDATIGVALGMITFGAGTVYGTARMARKLQKLSNLLQKAEEAYGVYQEIREVYDLLSSTDVAGLIARYEQKKEELTTRYELAESLSEEQITARFGEGFDEQLSNLEEEIVNMVYDLVLNSGLLNYLYLPESAQDASGAISAIIDLVEGIPAGVEAMQEMVQAYHSVDSTEPTDEQLGTLSVRALRTGSRFYPLVGLLLELVNQKLDNVIAEIDDRDLLDSLLAGGSRKQRRNRHSPINDRRKNRNKNQQQVSSADTRAYNYNTPDVSRFLSTQAAPLFKNTLEGLGTARFDHKMMMPAQFYPKVVRELRKEANKHLSRRTVKANKKSGGTAQAPVPAIKVQQLSQQNERFRIAINPDYIINPDVLVHDSNEMRQGINAAFKKQSDQLELPYSFNAIKEFLKSSRHASSPIAIPILSFFKAQLNRNYRQYKSQLDAALQTDYLLNESTPRLLPHLRLRGNSTQFIHISVQGVIRKGIDLTQIDHFIGQQIRTENDLPEGYVLTAGGEVAAKPGADQHLVNGTTLPGLQLVGDRLAFSDSAYEILLDSNSMLVYSQRIIIVLQLPNGERLGFYRRTGKGGASSGANASNWVPFWGIIPTFRSSLFGHAPKQGQRFDPVHPGVILDENGDPIEFLWFNKWRSSNANTPGKLDRYGSNRYKQAGLHLDQTIDLKNYNQRSTGDFQAVNDFLRRYGAPVERVLESAQAVAEEEAQKTGGQATIDERFHHVDYSHRNLYSKP